MTKSEEYNLFFSTYNMNSGKIKPTIETTLINGNSINNEIASFLESNGVVFTQDIINEINSLNFSDPIESYIIWGGNEDESIEIKSPPSRVIFNKAGTNVEVPIDDFLLLLQEWKAFLQTIPSPHWLSNR